jgi:hypothetical protein
LVLVAMDGWEGKGRRAASGQWEEGGEGTKRECAWLGAAGEGCAAAATAAGTVGALDLCGESGAVSRGEGRLGFRVGVSSLQVLNTTDAIYTVQLMMNGYE